MFTKSLFALVMGASLLFSLELPKYGEFHFEKLHKNVYVMHGPATAPNKQNKGFMNNPAIIISKNGLIVVDPGGSYNIGKEVLIEIEKVSKKPILAVFNTHKHGDHWFANKAVVQKYPNALIYAHEQMIKEVKAGEAEKWYDILQKLTGNLKGTKAFAYPTRALHEGDRIVVDGEEFFVHHPQVAHTDTDLLIEHTNSKTLFLGDNVMNKRFGAFDESSSVFGNKALLEELMQQKELAMYVPGHGRSGSREETVKPYLHYLSVITKYAQKAYDEDREAYELKKEVQKELSDYKDWDGIEYTLGRHLDKAYIEIEMSDEDDE